LPNVIETIEFLREAGIGADIKILVGGAPITPDFAKESKADGYAPDAGSAIQIAKKIMADDF
jgi:5-methyltetrahydrofolate--homocysteine methyltransferase